MKKKSFEGTFNSHICNIYRNEEEKLTVLTSFVLSGIENNEKCMIIIQNAQQDQLLKELQKYVEIDDYLDSNQVEFQTIQKFFFDGDTFSPYRVIIKLKEEVNNLISLGLSKLRIAGEMTWTITSSKILQDFLSFEQYITDFCIEDNCSVLDQFDINRINFESLSEIITLHPIAIIGTKFYNKSNTTSDQKKIARKLGQYPESSKELLTILEMLDFKHAKDLHIWNAFSHSEKPTIVLDEDGTIFNCNLSMERLTGYRKDEIKDLESWFSILIPEQRNRDLIIGILKNSEKMRNFRVESELLQKKGEKVWVEFTFHEAYDTDFPSTLYILQAKDITSRKKKEEQLIFHAGLLESVQESIVAVNLNKKIIYWGKGAESLYGYRSEEVIGAPITIILTDPEKEYQIIKKTIEANSWKGQTIQRRKDGTTFWTGSRVSLVKDQDGYPCGFLRIDVDISGYKQTEKELKISERKYRKIFNSSPIGMLEYQLMEDGRLVFLEANPSAGKIWGVDTNQFIGKTIEEAFPPLSQTEVPDNFRKVAQTGQEWRLEQITYEDSQIKGIYEVVAFQTEPMKMVASFHDRTSPEHAKKMLQESEEKYQSLMENIQEGVILEDTNREFTFVNKKMCNMLGYNEDEILGKNWNSIVSKNELNGLEREFKKTTSGLKNSFESTLVTKEGKIIPVFINTTPVYSDSKSLNGVLSVLTDVSVLKQAEIDRTNFVAMASHELRTPLTIIRWSSEFLYHHYEDINKDQRKENLESVLRNITRLERLVNGVLEISKIENNNFKIELKEIDFCVFMRTQEKLYKKQLKDQIKFFQPPRFFSAYVNADQDRIRFVFDNLIENAVKHTSKEFRDIVVRTEVHPNSVQISVTDNGAGISSENIKKIFEQFVSVPTKYSVNGTGIGLFISQQTILAHGGSLTARSEGIDCGAEFTLTLPRKLNEKSSFPREVFCE
ncbi:MAG: PAS domain S-box protein [Candidatus Hodarchaeales archaeon]